MKYLLILGRNIKLSSYEVICFFEKIDNPVLEYSINKNAILIEVKKPVEKGMLKSLGGAIAIGEIFDYGNIKKLIEKLENKMIYPETKNNFSYILWNFCDEDSLGKISEYLKKRFRSEKLKASEKKLPRIMISQEGKALNLPSSSLIDKEYFIFESKELYFGVITEKCKYDEIENRDMKKPVRREELSISPRLAKIMINLSKIKKEEKLLDPFCGVGAILQEALIQNIKVIGIDNDKTAIDGARQNLQWAKFSPENYKLILFDSTKASVEKCEAIVTEPDLGELLRNVPTKEKAREIIIKFEDLIISVINNLKRNVYGRIVFTSPLILVGDKRISCDSQKIVNKTGMKLLEGFPIPEYRENSLVGRNIFVLEK